MPGAMMRLLMIVGVLLCSMHLAESASAHATSAETAFHLAAGDGDGTDREPASNLAHGGHHHCPIAPDLRAAGPDEPWAFTHAPLFAANTAPLRSRTLPPLLDPPLSI